MTRLHLLGTGAPASDPHRTTTMLSISDKFGSVLIDCGGDALQRAMMVGIEVGDIKTMILTHEHPDHVGGWPLFLEKIWLHGQTPSFSVYGPAPALEQARKNFAAYDTSNWAGLPDVAWRAVPLDPKSHFLTIGPLRFSSTPTTHAVPCVAIRVDNTATGGSMCYSADTTPSDDVAELATGCHILVHEASGDNPVHSSAEDAARIARRAGCKRLILVHLPMGMTDDDLGDARAIFPDVSLGEELGEYTF